MMSLQEEAEALHNMRNDGTQLAMLPFVVSSSQADFGQSMELYPGKWVKANAPREDIIIHKFPDIGPSAVQAEGIVQDYANRATGASDTLSGRDVGGYNRIGATGTQFLASQSTSYLDTLSTQMANKFTEIGQLLLFRMVKHSDAISLDALDEADQQLCRQVYALNVEDIPTNFKFKTRLSTIQESKMAQQQASMGLFQLYTAYGDKMTEIASQLSNPQLQQAPRLMEIMQTYAVGLTGLMEKVMHNYDEDNAGDYLPFVEDLRLQLKAADDMRQMEVNNAREATVPAGQIGVPEAGPLATDQGGGGVPVVNQGAGAGAGQGVTQGAGGTESIGGEPV